MLYNINEPRHEKFNKLVSDQVRHKPSCTNLYIITSQMTYYDVEYGKIRTSTDGKRLEILDLESRGIVLSM